MNTLLSGMAYILIGAILLVASMAGYGGWMLWKQIQFQRVTVAQLDTKYEAEVKELRETNAQLQSLLEKQDAFLRKQQGQINTLTALNEQNVANLKVETQARLRQEGLLGQRLQRVEQRWELLH